VTPALSAAPLELPHPTRVELLLPDDMADTRHCYCYVPASRTAQSNDDENDVEDRRGTAKTAKKSFTIRQSLAC